MMNEAGTSQPVTSFQRLDGLTEMCFAMCVLHKRGHIGSSSCRRDSVRGEEAGCVSGTVNC